MIKVLVKVNIIMLEDQGMSIHATLVNVFHLVQRNIISLFLKQILQMINILLGQEL